LNYGNNDKTVLGSILMEHRVWDPRHLNKIRQFNHNLLSQEAFFLAPSVQKNNFSCMGFDPDPLGSITAGFQMGRFAMEEGVPYKPNDTIRYIYVRSKADKMASLV